MHLSQQRCSGPFNIAHFTHDLTQILEVLRYMHTIELFVNQSR